MGGFTASMSSVFTLYKISMSMSSFFMSYRTPMSSIFYFMGLQGPLFGVTGLQCPFVFFGFIFLFSLASNFERLDRSNEISVIIFSYLLFSIKDK